MSYEKTTEMNYGSYFCSFQVYYDLLHSNESFLLVNFNFQGQALYSGGIREPRMCEFSCIFSHSAAKTFL